MQNKTTMVWRQKIAAIIFMPQNSHMDDVRNGAIQGWLGNEWWSLSEWDFNTITVM